MTDRSTYNSIEAHLILGLLDLAILKVLADAGTDGLPLKLLAVKVSEILFGSPQESEKRERAVLVSVYRRLTSWEKENLGLVFYRVKPVSRDFRVPKKMSRNPINCYVLESQGRAQLEKMQEVLLELNSRIRS